MKKTLIYYLGSSVTRGHKGDTDGYSFAEAISEICGNDYQKEAISGTTLSVLKEKSYVERLNNFDYSKKPDAFIIQLSTNDFKEPYINSIGNITADFDKNKFDTATIIGSIEYIIGEIREKLPNTEIYFYSCPMAKTRHNYSLYKDFNEKIMPSVIKKWGIGYIDLFALIDTDEIKCLQEDGLHPTREGYKNVISPIIIRKLKEKIEI